MLSLQQSRTQSSLHDINRSLVKKTWPEVIVVKPLNNESNRDTYVHKKTHSYKNEFTEPKSMKINYVGI